MNQFSWEFSYKENGYCLFGTDTNSSEGPDDITQCKKIFFQSLNIGAFNNYKTNNNDLPSNDTIEGIVLNGFSNTL